MSAGKATKAESRDGVKNQHPVELLALSRGIETTLLKKNNSLEDSVGNEEKGYPVPDPNKTMINVTKEPSDTHKKKILKEGNLEKITEKFMEKILDMVNQKYKMYSRNFKAPKKKKIRYRNK
jgi:hypothetical protein